MKLTLMCSQRFAIQRGETMPDSTIIEYCSPTLAGIKTGNMFTVQLELNRISDELAAINRRIIGYGLRLVLLRYHEGRAL